MSEAAVLIIEIKTGNNIAENSTHPDYIKYHNNISSNGVLSGLNKYMSTRQNIPCATMFEKFITLIGSEKDIQGFIDKV